MISSVNVVALKRAGLREKEKEKEMKKWSVHLSPLATDSSGQLDVLGHDGDPLGVDGAEVGVFEQSNQVGFAGLLQSHHG